LGTGLGKKGATLPQIDVLEILSVSRMPLTPGAVAFLHVPTTAQCFAQLIRMSRAGLVRRTRSKNDQRVVGIRIQPKGKELLKKTRRAGIGQARRLLKSSLSDEEIKRLGRLLRKIRDRALRELGMKADPLPETVNVPDSCPG
jgi:DNA-binding MarR family transcriptional regulator